METTESKLDALRRAVGEVTMIVVGVLLALAASDWQQDRAERKAERDVMEELSTQLEADVLVLESFMDRYVSTASRVTNTTARSVCIGERNGGRRNSLPWSRSGAPTWNRTPTMPPRAGRRWRSWPVS